MQLIILEKDTRLGETLTRHFLQEGHQVTLAADVGQVESLLKKGHPDLLMVSIDLPDDKSEALIQKIRTLAGATPILAVTGVNQTQRRTRLLNLGADDYLFKPFSFVELLSHAENLARRTGIKLSSGNLTLGPIKLEAATRMAYVKGKRLKLRMKEYDLLEYMGRHPNQLISRSALLERVWEYDAKIASNTVDSHVSLLRKKLGRDVSKKVIETVHNMGYMVRAQ